MTMHSKGTPVFRMAKGGDVTKMTRLELEEYITKNYLPTISSAEFTYSFTETGFSYDLLGNRELNESKLMNYYKNQSDFTQISLAENSQYRINDWDMVEIIQDPETDELIEERELEMINSDNTYNFSYLGLIDLNWRVYYDEIAEKYFYVIHPHLGGDIRGNYGEALILSGEDKDDLFYRYYNEFIGGLATISISFTDGSQLIFDSEQDSDVFRFYFVEENSTINGKIAQKFVDDFNKFTMPSGDEFLIQVIEEYKMSKNEKFIRGGSVEETPSAYIEILGYGEGQWFDLSNYDSGEEFMDAIQEFMNELNEVDGANREEYRVADFEGFGNSEYYEYMGESEFDNIIQGFKEFESYDFPVNVVEEYRSDMGLNDYSDTLQSMDNSYLGKYDSYDDYGYDLVKDGTYKVTAYDIYLTDTDKRVVAGDETDYRIGEMDFDELLDIAENTKNKYENQKENLENSIEELNESISDLESLIEASDEEEENLLEQIGELQEKIEELEYSLNDLEDDYFDEARNEAYEIIYDEITYRLENDLIGYLEELGYEDFSEINWVSVNYEKIGEEFANDTLVIDYDGELYMFSNYGNGGKVLKTKSAKMPFYLVEETNNKIVSGFNTKDEAIKTKSELVRGYRGLKFNVYTLDALESRKNLNVLNKSEYISLKDLDSASKVALNPSPLNVAKYKTKSGLKKGASFLKQQWQEADFGDGKGGAKFDNGGLANDRFNEVRKRYDMIDLSVKMKIASVLGIDEAMKYLSRYENYAISPYDLLTRAVYKDFISVDEIDENLLNEAKYESESVEESYAGTGEGIGSSDINAFIVSMLRGAGYKIEVINNSYERMDRYEKEQEKLQQEQEKLRSEQLQQEKEKLQQEQEKLQQEQEKLKAEQEKLKAEQLQQEQEEREIDSYKIIVTPAKKYIISDANGMLIKQDEQTKTFDTREEAKEFVRNNLGDLKANVGLILMATEKLQQQQQAQQQAQAQAQQQAQQQAIENQKKQDEEIQKESTSTEIIDTKINVPKMADGGLLSFETCVDMFVERLNKFQKVIAVFTNEGKLVIMFESEVLVDTLDVIADFINLTPCKHVFSDELDFDAYKSKRAISIPILTDYREIELMEQGGELWIQEAVKEMKEKGTEGAFTKQAKREGMDTISFAKKVINNPDKYADRTFKRAMFVKNTNPEKFK